MCLEVKNCGVGFCLIGFRLVASPAPADPRCPLPPSNNFVKHNIQLSPPPRLFDSLYIPLIHLVSCSRETRYLHIHIYPPTCPPWTRPLPCRRPPPRLPLPPMVCLSRIRLSMVMYVMGLTIIYRSLADQTQIPLPASTSSLNSHRCRQRSERGQEPPHHSRPCKW